MIKPTIRIQKQPPTPDEDIRGVIRPKSENYQTRYDKRLEWVQARLLEGYDSKHIAIALGIAASSLSQIITTNQLKKPLWRRSEDSSYKLPLKKLTQIPTGSLVVTLENADDDDLDALVNYAQKNNCESLAEALMLFWVLNYEE